MLSVSSFPSLLMCDQKTFGFFLIESPRKSDRKSFLDLFKFLWNCFLTSLNSFQCDCLPDFFVLLHSLCFNLVCLLKLRLKQGKSVIAWGSELVRYTGVHYASEPMLKHIPLCIYGFVLCIFKIIRKVLQFFLYTGGVWRFPQVNLAFNWLFPSACQVEWSGVEMSGIILVRRHLFLFNALWRVFKRGI